MTPITDKQLGAIVYLRGRPGTPSDIRELLSDPLIEQTSEEWAKGFVRKLSDADWEFVRDAIQKLEDRNNEKLPVLRKNA